MIRPFAPRGSKGQLHNGTPWIPIAYRLRTYDLLLAQGSSEEYDCVIDEWLNEPTQGSITYCDGSEEVVLSQSGATSYASQNPLSKHAHGKVAVDQVNALHVYDFDNTREKVPFEVEFQCTHLLQFSKARCQIKSYGTHPPSASYRRKSAS